LRTLEEYLALQYRVNIIAEPEGGYFIDYPDLPGCMSQAETLEEAFEAAQEIRELWITAAYESGFDIPLPSYQEELSGKFNLRLPKSLHRRLVDTAEAEGVSLNQLIVSLLSEQLGTRQLWTRVEALADQVLALTTTIQHRSTATTDHMSHAVTAWKHGAVRQTHRAGDWFETSATHAPSQQEAYSATSPLISEDDEVVRVELCEAAAA
jgi:antitoxin HicB